MFTEEQERELLDACDVVCDVETPVDERMETEADYLRAMDELSNWGRWGEDDELGAANLITSENLSHSRFSPPHAPRSGSRRLVHVHEAFTALSHSPAPRASPGPSLPALGTIRAVRTPYRSTAPPGP